MRQALGPGALGRPRGSRWRGRWEGGSGWGTHVNPWLIQCMKKFTTKKKKIKKKNLNKGTSASQRYRISIKFKDSRDSSL